MDEYGSAGLDPKGGEGEKGGGTSVRNMKFDSRRLKDRIAFVPRFFVRRVPAAREPRGGDVRPQGGRQRQPRRAVAGGVRPLQLRQLRRARRLRERVRLDGEALGRQRLGAGDDLLQH